jgi:glycosyltransferase involved in cell wall biosynthesis
MRVALNLEQLLQRPPGGIGRYTAELARLLPAPDPDGGERIEVIPFVAWHRRSAIATALGAFGLTDLEPVVLGLPRPVLYDTWSVLGIPPLGMLHPTLRGVDLIHAPSLAVPPRSGARLIVTVHDAATLVAPETYPARGRRFHRRGFAAAARRADLVIAPTNAAAEEILARTAIRPDQVRVVPHGVEQRQVSLGVAEATRATLGLGDEPYVLWVGTLEPRKNLLVLLDAFRAVVRAGLPERLVIAGPAGWRGAPRAVAAFAEDLGDRIRFTGAVRADRLAALYRGASLFAFPSIHEGFGLPVLEAMAQGAAVVCSDIPALREVGGPAARFVPPTDAGAWGETLVALLGDEAERARMGAASLDWASEFTWDRCIRGTRRCYEDVLGSAQ